MLKNRKQRGVVAVLGMALAVFVLGGCASEREVDPIIANPVRIQKNLVEDNTYSFLKTVSSVEFPGKNFAGIPSGYYVTQNKLVQFVIKEHVLEIVSVDPLFHSTKAAKKNTILASFPIEHVDVLRKQNVDKEDTHEEEETDDRRVWQEREYIKVDIHEDSLSAFTKETVVANPWAKGIDIDENGAINFLISRHLNDDTVVQVRYSLVKFKSSSTYKQRMYPRDLQKRFGFFKTSTYKFDSHGRITQDDVKDYTNRWDTQKTVVYHLSKDFPEHLKPAVKKVFANWNASFMATVGHNVLKLEDWSGQELGDLRYNIIYYENSDSSSHRILGYGPSYTNPRTGEIIKADVILYGGTLRRSVFSERIWDTLLDPKQTSAATPATGSPKTRILNTPQSFKEGVFGEYEGAKLNDADSLIAMLNTQVLDQNFMTEFQQEYSMKTALPRLKAALQKDLTDHIARVDANFLAAIQEAKHGGESGPISDQQLEIRIFMPLLTHELGHNLGLRHNFMASADHKHFNRDTKTSSVMDYGYLTSHEGMDLGQYDLAAIEILYGNNVAKSTALLADNFYFCTDDGIMDSRNALCSHFDAGTTLTEQVDYNVKRYNAAWVFNNLRLGRKHWSSSSQAYINRVLRYLMPLRLVYDNAHAIVDKASSTDPSQLWYITRQRIEADSSSDPKQVVTIKVAAGYKVDTSTGNITLEPKIVERKIDMNKVQAVVQDAAQAKVNAMFALVQIILESDRPLFNSGDQVHDELQIRGVIFDKLLSLLLVANRTGDPSGSGAVITPFATFPNGVMANFLNGILTNTLKARNPTTGALFNRQFFYDVNVRQMALQLLKSELIVPGSSAKARQMLNMDRVTIDTDTIDEISFLEQVVATDAVARPLLEDKEKELKVGDLFKALVAAKVSPMALFQYVPQLITITEALTEEQRTMVLSAIDSANAKRVSLSKTLTDEEEDFQQINRFRIRISQLYSMLFEKILFSTSNEPDPLVNQIQLAIGVVETERAKINTAFAPRHGKKYFMAPEVNITSSFESATGVLMRDNYNRMADQAAGLTNLAAGYQRRLTQELAKPEDQRDQKLIAELQDRIQRAVEFAGNIEDYLASEILFIESFQLFPETR